MITPKYILWPKQALVLLGAIIVLTFCYFQTRTTDPERHFQIGNHLQQMKQLEAMLNQDVLKIKTGVLRNYDPLVETVGHLRALLRDLREGPIAIYGFTESRIDDAFEAYSKLLDIRVSILERFKSKNAILRISQSYFPVVVAELTARATKRGEDNDLATALNELSNGFLSYYGSSDAELRPRLRSQIQDLIKVWGGTRSVTGPQVDVIAAHANIILKYQREVEGLVEEFLSMSSDERISDLYWSYLTYYARLQERASFYRNVLIIVSALLMGYIAYFMIQLRSAGLSLARVNETLNHRTVELASKIEELQTENADRKRAEAALRKSEEWFRSVVNNSPTKIHIKDTEGRYLLVNSEAERMFGVTMEEARGKRTHEIFPDKQADRFRAHDQAVLESGQTIAEEEQWALDDGVHTYLTVKFPIRDGDGEIVAIGAIGTDITERKQAEAAISVAMGEANIANRTKSEFLAAMSHELRTPLNAIIGFSEVIKNETFGPVGSLKYRDYGGDIHESGQHLLGLINDILDLSKIESGSDELNEDTIEIPELVRAALKLVGHRAEQGGLKLEFEPSDPLPALRADERKLKQILVNLLSNAIKFTDAGGEVTFRVWCRMDSGHVFQIADTGIGIAPEDVPKALSRFGQVDGDLSRQYEGAGLGLPLTKALVELHGGVLDLQSEVGVGTTVTVRFPAERIVASLDNSDSLDLENRGPV